MCAISSITLRRAAARYGFVGWVVANSMLRGFSTDIRRQNSGAAEMSKSAAEVA